MLLYSDLSFRLKRSGIDLPAGRQGNLKTKDLSTPFYYGRDDNDILYTTIMNSLLSRAIFTFLLFPLLTLVSLSSSVEAYEVARVQQILQQETIQQDNQRFYIQTVEVQKADGSLTSITYGTEFQPLNETQLLSVGQQVVVEDQAISETETQTFVTDMYRLPMLLWLFVGFFILVLLVAGKRGFLAVIGMGVSLLILSKFLVPFILSGSNPLLISMIAAVLIATITVYLSHGFSLQSHISLFSMISTLGLVILLANIVTLLGHLFGFGSEEAAFLQIGETANINIRGLLLGGIMLGALGVLDDICISQVSTVFELKKANMTLSFNDLYQRSMNVGKNHVASLVNTLLLAYAGTNLPLFILLTLGDGVPLWARINSELIAEEIVRTLVGSIGLVIAVPLTTLVATYWATKVKMNP